MTKARSSLAIYFLLSLAIASIGSACGPRRSANEKRYPIKGKVIAVDKTDRSVTIAHEDINGYMPAMTMPFKIKNDADLEMVKPGDQLAGTLVVDDLSSWVEVSAILEGGPPVSQDVDVPGEPKPGTEVPDFGLVNQDGQRIHLWQLRICLPSASIPTMTHLKYSAVTAHHILAAIPMKLFSIGSLLPALRTK